MLIKCCFNYQGFFLIEDEGLVFHFVDAITNEKVLALVNCLNDTFEQNKTEAFRILTSLPERCLLFLVRQFYVSH